MPKGPLFLRYATDGGTPQNLVHPNLSIPLKHLETQEGTNHPHLQVLKQIKSEQATHLSNNTINFGSLSQL
jgi:hypothetical protein